MLDHRHVSREALGNPQVGRVLSLARSRILERRDASAWTRDSKSPCSSDGAVEAVQVDLNRAASLLVQDGLGSARCSEQKWMSCDQGCTSRLAQWRGSEVIPAGA